MGVLTSGDIASFLSPAEANITSLKAYFQPKQAGSGDPSPSNVREITGWNSVNITKTGKNLLGGSALKNAIYNLMPIVSVENNIIKYSNANASSHDGEILYNKFKPNKQYTFIVTYSKDTNRYIHLRFDYSDGTYSMMSRATNITSTDKTTEIFVSTINKTVVSISRQADEYSTVTMYCDECGLFEGNITLQQFESYRGQTIPVTFPVLGKNKLDISNLTHNNWNIGNIPNNLIPNTTYTYSITGTTSYKYKMYLSSTGYDGNLALNNSYIASGETSTFTTPSDMNDYPYIALCGLSAEAGNEDIANIKPQLELGSTASTYEPYNADNTVYGGYVDIAKGEVVATHKKIAIPSNDIRGGTGSFVNNTQYQGNIFTHRYFVISEQSNTSGQLLGNYMIKGNTYGSAWKINFDGSGLIHYSVSNESIGVSSETTASDRDIALASWLSNYNPYIVYSLKTPIHYPLTPTQLRTLIGQNNIWSNTNSTIEVEYDLYETKSIQQIKKRIIANEPHLKTASNSIASFSTDMKAPLKECKVHFSPVQEGTGDPSPSNVRPITGWTGVSVYKTGKNLINESHRLDGAQFKTVNGVYQIGSANVYSICSIPVPKNTDLHISKSIKTGSELAFGDVVGIMGTPVVVGGSMNNYFNRNFNSGERTYAYLMFGKTTTLSDPTTQWQLEFGDEKTAYEAPKGMTELSVTFPSEAGTVYGGYVDLVNGELVQTYSITNLNTLNWVRFASAGVYLFAAQISEKLLPKTIPCYIPIYKYITDEISVSSLQDKQFTAIGTNTAIYIRDDDYTDANSFTTAMNGIQIVYPLATPITYPINSQTLKTLRGTNNVWSNANGNIELAYYSH